MKRGYCILGEGSMGERCHMSSIHIVIGNVHSVQYGLRRLDTLKVNFSYHIVFATITLPLVRCHHFFRFIAV